MSIRIDDVVGLHSRAIELRMQRSEILAANLANEDTPGFLARDIDFAGEMRGFLQPGGTFEGTYHVDATGGSSLIGALDLSQISASSTGTWTAAPVP